MDTILIVVVIGVVIGMVILMFRYAGFIHQGPGLVPPDKREEKNRTEDSDPGKGE